MPSQSSSEKAWPLPDVNMERSGFRQPPAASATQGEPASPVRQVPILQEIDLVTPDVAEEDVSPPAYGDEYGEIRNEKDGLDTSAYVTDDGRVNIRINQLNRRLSQIFTPALHQHIQDVQDSRPVPLPYIPPALGGATDVPPPPPLNIVIQVVGSRGDVQPFVALGKVLKETYGHRVRLATHPNFKDFVEEHNLEFFSIGGDPTRLMAFMVKNPGLRPGFRSVASGDIGQRRKDVAEYIQGCWRSCYQAGDGLDFCATEDDLMESIGNKASSGPKIRPFVADCIIANPPSFAHIHCAEKLGIPLHMMFTMPYSPTQAFPHPLANIQSSSADPQLTNYISYAMIELLSWQGLGDIINRFRAKCLGLDPVSLIWAPGMLQRLRIPHTYCWSPALIPKPNDWGPHISISGFYFLNLASDYTPAPDLQAFLDKGPTPVYIGFGSIVLDDPNAMTELVFEAARKTGQRVLLSKGWGGMGADELTIPDNVFMLGNVPHDWLFKHVSCVVHHGGAGTTAAGITAGRPTIVVPFFGDQPFWGAMVARAGAGPKPIPHKKLTAERLVEAINFCLEPETLERAKELASKIAEERGTDMGAQSFHQYLEVDRLRCTLSPSRSASWRIRRTQVKLSAFAACTLENANLLDFQDLKLFRPQEHYTDEGPWDPISGGFTAFTGAIGGMIMGLADIPTETWKAIQMPAGRSRQQSQTSIRSIATKSKESVVESNPSQLTSSAQNGNKENRSGRPNPTSHVQSSTMSSQSQGQKNRDSNNDTSKESHNRFERGQGANADMLRPTGVHMSKGAGRFVNALVHGPVNISVNLTRGMHNVPKMWGDNTVRPQERVNDFRSGVKAVSREFGFGFYDGITGLVTQPWRGAQESGASGFVKGLGKGIGGFPTKLGAACLGILSHTMQGVSKEMQRLFGSNVQDYIVASRAAQGYEEWLQSSNDDKQDVIARWKMIQKHLKKKVMPDEMLQTSRREQQSILLRDENVQNNARSTNKSTDSGFRDLNSSASTTGSSRLPPRAANTAPRLSTPTARSTPSEYENENDGVEQRIQADLSSFQRRPDLHEQASLGLKD